MELTKLGEFLLIERIARQAHQSHPAVLKGIGDDAAVIQINQKERLLITTDTLTEGVHFTASHTTPELLGKKSISVNLSDIAAMGGTPLCYVVSLSIPPSTSYSFVRRLYQGMRLRSKKYGVHLVGGDTTAAQDRITICITMIGTAAGKHLIYRSGAQTGDSIYVTGVLGDAHLGLQLLQKKTSQPRSRELIKKHLDPVPRITEGQQIAQLRLANSMIDISDGLLADLRHILQQSRSGAHLWLSRLPLSAQYRKWCSTLADDWYGPALSGGEDYELLFTVPKHKKNNVERWSKTLKIPVTCIGKITGNAGELRLFDINNKEVIFKKEGFTHF